MILLLSIPFLARAREKETARQKSQEETAELAKKLANPIASLISVPFQNYLQQRQAGCESIIHPAIFFFELEKGCRHWGGWRDYHQLAEQFNSQHSHTSDYWSSHIGNANCATRGRIENSDFG